MSEHDRSVPVLAIDGGAGTGKGTARTVIAARLGFHSLDSGVLYRALGVVCDRQRITQTDQMVAAAAELSLEFSGDRILLGGADETAVLRSDEAGALASAISAIPEVRAALLRYQLSMRVAPGLVADGRDQCVIFDTPYRYFLVCDPVVRARRRELQFREAGLPASFEVILQEILRRDEADATRAAQPLAPHPDALIIDTSNRTIEETADIILADYVAKRAQG